MVSVVTIRPGVQFIAPAARAFHRAEAQVIHEFGREIDVNSTYRDWGLQLSMWQAWTAWTEGRGPKPNHSQAAHPKYSRHTQGAALDSDDWVNPRIVEILTEHGFIRNQLHVPNEQHHFEWLADHDQHIDDPAPGETSTPAPPEPEKDDMAKNVMYATTDKNFKYRIAVANDVSGLWLEYVSNTPTLNNELADRYDTGSAVNVSNSMFAAAKHAHASIRPRAEITVTVGEAGD